MKLTCPQCGKPHEANPLIDCSGFVTCCSRTGTLDEHTYGVWVVSYCDVITAVHVGFEADAKNIFMNKEGVREEFINVKSIKEVSYNTEAIQILFDLANKLRKG